MILYSILYLIGSQCNASRQLVALSYFPLLSTTLAAIFCILWSFAMLVFRSPPSKLLV